MAGPGSSPVHPILVPGCRVLRRDARTLQIGVGERVLLAPDLPAVRDLLDTLRHGAAQPPLTALSPLLARLVCELLERGLVTDSAPLLRALGTCPGPSAREQHAADSVRLTPAAAPPDADPLRVAVLEAGLPTWARHARSLLETAGIAVTDAVESAQVVLLLSAEPVDRRQVDAWMRADLAHLILDADDARVRLGPFVLPGRSTCLRCVDAFATDHDPHHPLLIEQRRGAATPSGLPLPIAHDLVAIGTAMAVRELGSFAEGGTPATLEQTIEIDPALEFPTTHWGRHPACGCGWDQLPAG